MTVFGRGDGSSGATAAYGEREGIFTANVKEWEMVAATCEKEESEWSEWSEWLSLFPLVGGFVGLYVFKWQDGFWSVEVDG